MQIRFLVGPLFHPRPKEQGEESSWVGFFEDTFLSFFVELHYEVRHVHLAVDAHVLLGGN